MRSADQCCRFRSRSTRVTETGHSSISRDTALAGKPVCSAKKIAPNATAVPNTEVAARIHNVRVQCGKSARQERGREQGETTGGQLPARRGQVMHARRPAPELRQEQP